MRVSLETNGLPKGTINAGDCCWAGWAWVQQHADVDAAVDVKGRAGTDMECPVVVVVAAVVGVAA